MAKSRKQILLELLDLEETNLGEVGKNDDLKDESIDCIDAVVSQPKQTTDDSITKPKKQLSAKQLEVLKKGQQIRDENTKKRKEAAERLAEEERKKTEEKIVKKAIAIKKRQIKKAAVIDEVPDDDTPIEKIKEIANKSSEPTVPLRPLPPKFIFF